MSFSLIWIYREKENCKHILHHAKNKKQVGGIYGKSRVRT